jgi:opacity protein-like surface antigen
MKQLTGLILASIILISANVQAASSRSKNVTTLDECYTKFIENRLSVGFRVSNFNFTDPKQKSYNSNGDLDGGYTHGISTYNLEERQSYMPTPYLIYKFCPYVALQVGWECIEGRAWTMDYADPHYNGDMTLSGPSFSLQGRYENKTAFTPYGLFGLAFLHGEFHESTNWGNYGARRMEVDNTTGVILSVGVSTTIAKHIELDLSLSHMQADPEAEYWLRPEGRENPRAEWEFPASSIITRLGIVYSF